jgi:hypothetical protein
VLKSPEEVSEWARVSQLAEVVCVMPPVGPNREPIERALSSLEVAQISVLAFRREWDALLYGLADKGFFPFWERVKKRIERGETLFRGKFGEK